MNQSFENLLFSLNLSWLQDKFQMTSVFIISKPYINTSAVERIEEKLKSLLIIQILNLSLLFLLNDYSSINLILQV